LKTEPGLCGCGTPDLDGDEDGAPDCADLCPTDPEKTEPGICGCGIPDDGDCDDDGTSDSLDGCLLDANKIVAGACGCGVIEGVCNNVNKNGLMGSYFNNDDFIGRVFQRVDPVVNFNFGKIPPDSRMQNTTYTIRWKGFVMAEYSATYIFHTETDDGVRLWVNDVVLINDWTAGGARSISGKIALQAGARYAIKMEYWQKDKDASARLLWACPQITKQTIPQSRLFFE
jgi:hypothetical protein